MVALIFSYEELSGSSLFSLGFSVSVYMRTRQEGSICQPEEPSPEFGPASPLTLDSCLQQE